MMLAHVSSHGRPLLTALPAGLPESVLAILPRCWADVQSDRPTSTEVCVVFEEALKAGAASSSPPSPFFVEKPPSEDKKKKQRKN